jgi:hypothetical protein
MNDITIDIDTPFKEYRIDLVEDAIARIPWVSERYIRCSSHGHVHLKVCFRSDISLFDSLCIRAYLGDDPKRLACDLRRFYLTRIEAKTGRCFDEKYEGGELHKAGQWVRF